MARACFVSSFLAPTLSGTLQGGDAAAGGRVVLLRHSAGRALLLVPATALVPVGGGAAARCTARGGYQFPFDEEGLDDKARKEFRERMQDLSIGVVVQGDKENMFDTLSAFAKEAQEMMARMEYENPNPFTDLDCQVRQDLAVLHMAFLDLERRCAMGCLTSNAVQAASNALVRFGDLLLGSGRGEGMITWPKWYEDKSEKEKECSLHSLGSIFSDVLYFLKREYGLFRRRVMLDHVGDELYADAMKQFFCTVVVGRDEKLLDDLTGVAKESHQLLNKMLKEFPSPVCILMSKDVALLSTAFLYLESQCKMGFVTPKSVEAAARALKTMAQVFVGNSAAETLPTISIGSSDNEQDAAVHVRQMATMLDNHVSYTYWNCSPNRCSVQVVYVYVLD